LTDEIDLLHAVVLGIVEGVTEFLPISSTGHLTIVERAFGYSTDSEDVTAFTAIIQVGAILAALLYLRDDAIRLVRAFVRGLRSPAHRQDPDYKFSIAIIIGSIPIGVVGLLFKDTIESELRSLWFVGWALILFSAVMLYADRRATQTRGEGDVRWHDTLIIGIGQCLALIPGVSRSGATISVGLLRGLDRVTVTRLSFFLAIPALTAAGLLEVVSKYDQIADGVGWGPTLAATAVSFVVGYASVAWLLRFVAGNDFTVFVVYRIVLGVVVLALVASGALDAT
jgi:undecaprenyl-diphosphatase